MGKIFELIIKIVVISIKYSYCQYQNAGVHIIYDLIFQIKMYSLHLIIFTSNGIL